MTRNALLLWPEILGVVGGGIILLLFTLALALPSRVTRRAGSRGHRDGDDEEEIVSPDGYIDSFAGVVEEAGGAYPPVVWLLLVGILAWWLLYLIYNLLMGGELVPITDPRLSEQFRIFFTR